MKRIRCVKNESAEHIEPTFKSLRHPRRRLMRRIFVVVVALVVVVLGYLLVSKLANTATKDDSKTEKVLNIGDLDNPDVKIDSETPSASVENLTNELKAKIDKQIAAKENPSETVEQLTGVLSNTTNKTRQDQLTDFLQDFLANHEDALWFDGESGAPDQAQVNYWKAGLYASLVHNYEFIMLNKFPDADGKARDTVQQQLKYIELYLALDNDPKSHPAIPEENRDVLVGYVYDETNYFLELKGKLIGGGGR